MKDDLKPGQTGTRHTSTRESAEVMRERLRSAGAAPDAARQIAQRAADQTARQLDRAESSRGEAEARSRKEQAEIRRSIKPRLPAGWERE